MHIVFQPGRYFGRITGQGIGELNNEKRTPYFALSFEVIGRVNPANPEGDLLACANGQRTLKLWLTEKAIERTIEDLRRLGFEGTSFRQLDPSASGGWNIVGHEIELYCGQEPDDRKPGEMQEKWGIARESGLKIAPLDQKGIKQLDAMFGKQLKTAVPRAQPASKPPSQPPAQPQTVPPDDAPDFGPPDGGDEIPF